jgi:hypothetical protein
MSDTERRTGTIRLSEGDLRTLLDLPENYQIVSVHSTFDPPGFTLLVQSPTLPTVSYDAESPRLDGNFSRTTKYDPADNKRWTRWKWELG